MLFRTMISSARPHDASELAAEKMKWLAEGCAICMETARTFAKILDLSLCANERIKVCLVYTFLKRSCRVDHVQTLRICAFYLESSAFALVYGSLLLDPAVYTENMPYLKTAAKSFRTLEQGFPLKFASYALAQMVHFLQSLRSRDGTLGNLSPATLDTSRLTLYVSRFAANTSKHCRK